MAETHRDKQYINYDKLRELCQKAKDESSPLDHADFMREYPLLFLPSSPSRSTRQRSKTLDSPKHNVTLHQLRNQSIEQRPRTVSGSYMTGKSSEELQELYLKRKLKTMADIALICPPLRAEEDTKKLASLLADFPALLPPNTSLLVRQRIAARAMADKVTDRRGMSLPREGGLNLILQGKVYETQKDLLTGKYTTGKLGHGEIFGEMKEMPYPPKLSYPTYLGERKSIVLRITLTDIQRSREMVEESEMIEHLRFIDTSPLLKTFPLFIRQKLAANIHWNNIPSNTKVLVEGEPVICLTIIKDGKCKVTKSIYGNLTASEMVCIGEVSEGSCLGELAIEGCEISPYTITSITQLTVGEISVECIRALDLANLMTPQQQYTISLPSEEEMRKLYAEKQIRKQWTSLKKEIVGQVYKERLGEKLKYYL